MTLSFKFAHTRLAKARYVPNVFFHVSFVVVTLDIPLCKAFKKLPLINFSQIPRGSH
jgi:hypothetical protein